VTINASVKEKEISKQNRRKNLKVKVKKNIYAGNTIYGHE